MEPTGCFMIRCGKPERVPTSETAEDGGADTPDAPRAAARGYALRLGWIEGAPYIADHGSAEPVLVNSAPIEPLQPFVLRAGDTISVGNTHLSWVPGSEKVTAVLARAQIEQAAPVIPASPATPAQKAKEPAALRPADETVAAPKQPAPHTRPETPDATVIFRRAVTPPLPETPKAEAQVSTGPATPPAVPSAQDTAPADMARLIEEKADSAFEFPPTARDTQTPHLVVYMGDRTWDVQFTKERMTMGRGEENDIDISDPFVSRHHASIERRGDAFLIREAQSRNGVWLGRQRVQEHMLRDGDVLHLGGASLVFKGGFTSEDLTLIGAPRIDGAPRRRPVVIVPGLMGSELWLGSERLWPNPKYLLSNPELFCLPGDPRIEARGIVNEVVIVPNIVKQRQYSALGDYLVAGLGYTRGKDLLEFAYDWRQDVRLAAQRLADAIQRWEVNPPVTIIAHSLGTLVTRYYVERLGGKEVVERILLMGGPHHGTPKGLAAILVGPGMLPFHIGAERMRNVLATFPSAYQILPVYPCIIDQAGTHIDALEDGSWLPEPQRPFLRAASSFRRELGQVSSVPAVSIFGYGFKTILRIKIDRRTDGQWHGVEFADDTAGDSSVPSGSAVLKGSEMHPVSQDHGALFTDDDVRMRLKVELTRSTTWQRRKY